MESLHPLFKTLFDYVKSHDLLHAELGRIEIKGDDLFINNVNPEGVAAEKQVLELHRAYIDVHILLEGKERIGWKAIEDLETEINLTRKREIVHSIRMYQPLSLICFLGSLRLSILRIPMLRLSVRERYVS